MGYRGRKSDPAAASEARADWVALKLERLRTQRLGYPASGQNYKDLGIAVLAMAVYDLNRHPAPTKEGETGEQVTRRMHVWTLASKNRKQALRFLQGGRLLRHWCTLAEFDYKNVVRRYLKEDARLARS